MADRRARLSSEDATPGPALRLVRQDEPSPDGGATGSSWTVLDVGGRLYRVHYWSSAAWEQIPGPDRPPVQPAHGGDGWFGLSPL